jgi:hypothetical protein
MEVASNEVFEKPRREWDERLSDTIEAAGLGVL